MNYTPESFRSSLIALSIVTLTLLGSGNAADGNPHSSSKAVARIGREFKLRVRQQVMLKGENLRIRFAEVKEDSRCPSDVTCVWAGNAAVRLDVSSGVRGNKSLTLNTTGNSPPVAYKHYELKLVDVSPYPRTSRKIAPREYVITLLVSKS
jgi:hypothetical protein